MVLCQVKNYPCEYFIFLSYFLKILKKVIFFLTWNYIYSTMLLKKGGVIVTFLEKLDKLMADGGLNKKTLSEKSGIAYTTIVNWYKRGYDNMTISIFKRLCDYFGVTMDSMARNDMQIEYYNPNKKDLHITREEEYLLKCYRMADDLDKSLALRAVKADEKESTKEKNQNAG